MIEVIVYRTDRKITAFELSGHAGSGPYGFDLVCAGVSAVTFGTTNAVLELCNASLGIEQGDEGGYLYVSLPGSLPEEVNDQVQLLFEGMIISLQTIENEYGQFINIQQKI